MKKIIFILPYFGKFNKYFPLFLKSCEYNSTVDWLIITDNQLDYRSTNIKYIYMTFSDFIKKVQAKYDFEIYIKEPYDLCDFKVAYGDIFAEEIVGYDYWGFCDCDLIWGNIRSFLTDDLLDSYDKIYRRGHCTLFKNEPEINRLYKNTINGEMRYRYVFTHSGAHHFDEGGEDTVLGINMIFKNAHRKIYDRYDFFDACVSKKKFIQADLIADADELVKSRNSVFLWKEGRLFRRYLKSNEFYEEDFLYIHLQKRKMKLKIKDLWNTNQMIILSNKFLKYKEISARSIKKTNRNGVYYAYWFNRIKKKLKRIFKK